MILLLTVAGAAACSETSSNVVYPSTMCASDHVAMNFGAGDITINNLGGEGPGAGAEEVLRLEKVGLNKKVIARFLGEV